MFGGKSDFIVTNAIKILFRSESLTCIASEPVQVQQHAINLEKNQSTRINRVIDLLICAWLIFGVM